MIKRRTKKRRSKKSPRWTKYNRMSELKKDNAFFRAIKAWKKSGRKVTSFPGMRKYLKG